MSKAPRRRTQNVDEIDFASLFHRFEDEYGDAATRLAEQLTTSYPEITKGSRRTGRTLGNICFFLWSCWRDGDRKLIPTLFRAAVLLSAQDDYYDNATIPAAQKDGFCRATNHALRTIFIQPTFEGSAQLRELTSLWSDVARRIPRSALHVRSYWIEKACELNDAMAVANRAARRATITYEQYMDTAIHSIGLAFIWATYLALKHVPVTTLREMDPVLLQGAKIVRLSNDMAGYRHQSKNAVSLVGNPEARIRRLMAQESGAFYQCVEALDVKPDVRDVLVRSMDFLREFYLRFDFHSRLAR